METIIKQLREKVKSIDDSTKENRARKGAYVDCILMINALNNCSNCGQELRPECIEDGDTICVDCFNDL